MNYLNVLIFITSAVLSLIGVPIILKVLKKGSTLSPNYKGEKIPVCMGLLFIFVQTINLSIVLLYLDDSNNYIMYYLFSIIFIGLVGLLDDLIGEEDIKGLKGHVRSFLKGNPTTGGIKALTGFFIALFISIVMSKDLVEIIVNTILIALFTNLINLFDLRPGRSIKVYITFSIILLITASNQRYDLILYSFFGILLIYFPLDIKAKVMMGDVGSNVLGITLGIYCVFTHNLTTKLVYMLVLIIIHILAEKFSFSKIIDNNKFLKFIDHLGR